jgi:hypothetical protein
VKALRAECWDNAVGSLDEIEQIAPTVPRGEREVDQAVDALQHFARRLRDDATKAELHPDVTAQRIADLEALTKDVAEAAVRTGHNPTARELREAAERPGPPDE